MSAIKTEPTTAQILGGFYKELLEEGVPVPLATELVIQARRDPRAPLTVKLDSTGAVA